jgi:diacylglycerol kinase (ATP)
MSQNATTPEASLPPQADRVVVSVNPKAGVRSSMGRVAELAESLRRLGLRVEILTDLPAAVELARGVHEAGALRALVGVGGDGTAAELANRIPPGLPLALMPAGNENLLARYLELPHSPEALARVVAEGAAARLDAGRAGGRLFLLMFSCGFDAEVVRIVHQRRTGHISKASYLKPIVEAVRTYSYPPLRAEYHPAARGEADGAPTALDARWLFAFNLPCYGGGFRLMPGARGADALLDVCAFRSPGFWNGLRFAAAVVLGRHAALGDCVMLRSRRIRVDSPGRVPYQLDGDPGGWLPVEIEVLPERLLVAAPRRRLARPL